MPADLDAIFKAYDIRGIDARPARRRAWPGPSAAPSPASRPTRSAGPAGARRPGTCGRRACELVGRLHRAASRPRARRRRPRPGLHRPPVLRRRPARRPRRHVHGVATTRPSTTASSSACPGPSRSARTPASREIKAMAAAARRARPPAAARRSAESLDLLRDFADHVRSFVDAAALRPLKVVADTANGMGGLVVPAVFEGLPFDLEVMYGELDGTFPNHPADPIQLENLRDLQARGAARSAPTSAWPSTATPTGCSSSTTRASRSPARPPPPWSPPACWRSIRAPRSCTTASARRPCPRSSASTAARRCAPGWATASSRRSWPRPAPPSAASTRPTTTSATTGGPTPGSIAALHRARAAAARPACPLSELRKPFDRYAASGELNSEVDDPPAVIERVAAAYPRRRPGPARRAHRRPRRLVVQPAPVQHRAAPPTQPRGAGSGILCTSGSTRCTGPSSAAEP